MTDTNKTLQELISITDTALVYAHKKNISDTSTCIFKRRTMLESLLNNITGISDQFAIKNILESLMEKDRELSRILETLKRNLSNEQEHINNKKKMRVRFIGKRSILPRFIDKKA
jgi:hypothetical protein